MDRKPLFILLALVLIQAACSVSTAPPLNATQAPSVTVIIPTQTSAPATDTAIPATPTLAASETAPVATTVPSKVPPAASPEPATPVPSGGASAVKIYLVAIGDNGAGGTKIGCGDSLIPVTVSITPTVAVLRAALSKLLSIKTQFYGASGLYNSLYQSNLAIDSLVIQNGVATIRLSGTISMGGECDTPRFRAQLEQTALQFSTVKQVSIFINNKPISEVLSLK
jgi:hypothetical protein